MNIEVVDANNVAKYFLNKMNMSQKKIHKLMYFAYSLYLVEYNNDEYSINNALFENHFEAWVHGPVHRQIYPIYASYSYKELYIDSINFTLPEKAQLVCDEILSMYGDLTANQLERMSHEDIAWIIPRSDLGAYDPCDKKLDDKLIFMSALERFYE